MPSSNYTRPFGRLRLKGATDELLAESAQVPITVNSR